LAHASITPFTAIALFFTSKIDSWKAELFALVILGAVRGIAINIGFGILDLEPTVSAVYKIFNSAISLPLWFIGLAVFVESRRHFQREFESIFLRSVRKEQTSSNKQSQDSTEQRDGQLIKHLQSVAANLASEIELMLNLPKSDINYSMLTNKIQSLINNELRPASAKLWNDSSLSAPKLSIGALIRISLLEQKLKVTSASLFFSPYIFIGLNGSQGWEFALVETILATSLNILVFLIGELLFKNGMLNRKSTNILIMGSSFVIQLLAILYILPNDLFWTDSDAAKFFYQLFISSCHIAILLGFNLYKLLGQQRSSVLQNLEQIIQGKELSPVSGADLTAVRDIDLARYLHGELQAGLIATSLILERASNTGDTDSAHQTLRSAIVLLRQDHARVSQSRIASPQSRLEKISAGWRGIAEVKISIDGINTLETSQLNDVIELIDEGVSNAIRHAKATKISVNGYRMGTDLHIEILSDGSGMSAKNPGLGTKLFNELTTTWKFTKQGNLNLLKFTVRTIPIVGE
jgi:signal transduction histidine kinase